MQAAVTKEHRLAGAGQNGLTRLLEVGGRAGAVGIEPAAAALGAAQAAKPAHDEEALELDRAAPLLVRVVARLGADPDAVEVGSLARHIVAALVEGVIPLRVLDDDLDLGIDLAGGLENVVARELDHKFAAVVLPGVASDRVACAADGDDASGARGLALGAFAIGEPEVVDHDLVEEAGGVFEHRLEFLLGLRIGVAGDLLPAGGVLAETGGGDTAGGLDAGGAKGVAGLDERGAVGGVGAAELFDIDLGDGGALAPVNGVAQSGVGGEVFAHVLGRE